MFTSKHSIKQVVDAVALQAGSKIIDPDITEYEGEQLVWRLQADSAQEQGDNTVLINPSIDMFTNAGENIPVQANQGVHDKKKQVVHFFGDVFVGYQAWDLRSEKLDFFELKDEVVIPDAFVLEQEGVVITGKYMRIFRESGRLEVLKGVHMKIEENP